MIVQKHNKGVGNTYRSFARTKAGVCTGVIIITHLPENGSSSSSDRLLSGRAAVGVTIALEHWVGSVLAGVVGSGLELAREREDLTADNSILVALAVVSGAHGFIFDRDANLAIGTCLDLLWHTS